MEIICDKKYSLISFIIISIFFSATYVYGADWRAYSKYNAWSFFYDKDSIHYPDKKKGVLGDYVTDKDIVGVWIKIVEVGKEDVTARIIFRCPQRVFTMYSSKGKLMSPQNEPVPPDDNYVEQLFKIICK